MTRAVGEGPSGSVPGASGLDGIGRLQLVGLLAYVSTAFAFVCGRVVGDIRGEQPPSATAWLISAGIGVVCGLAAAVLQYWTWRRRGGQRLVRLGRRAWRSGELPDALPVRVAVLRDLERRDRELDRQIPVIVLGVIWTINVVLHIVANRSATDVIGWLFIWGTYAAFSVQNIVDRRRWPRLRQLIAELREHPVGSVVQAR